MFSLTQSIVDECEQDEAKQQCIEFLEEGEDASEALQSSEQALILVAPVVYLPIVCPRGAPFLSYIGLENAPFDAMTGAISIAQSLFYLTDDKHNDELLGYYRQREWRITAGYYVNGVPRGRPLVDGEKRMLMNADSDFWNRRMSDGKEAFLRLDKAVVLSEPNPQTLRKMINRMIVPKEIVDEARQLFDDVAIDSI